MIPKSNIYIYILKLMLNMMMKNNELIELTTKINTYQLFENRQAILSAHTHTPFRTTGAHMYRFPYSMTQGFANC